MAWFSLNSDGNPTDASDYTLATSEPSCSGTPQQICAIQADNDGNDQPDLTPEVLIAMVQALHNGASTADVKLKNRPPAA